MAQSISVEEVDALLKEHARVSPTIRCPLNDAAGRVLREPLIADRDLPPYDRVMMDGYAVRTSGLQEGSFKIVGRALAGMPRQVLPEGDTVALEIATGAPMPEGANVVIPVEWTNGDAHGFALHDQADPQPDAFIHQRASDFEEGSILVQEGKVLGAAEAGIAASCGITEVSVSRQPRVGVFTTGDELVPIKAKPETYQIRRSNSYATQNALAQAGYMVQLMGHLSDDAGSEAPTLTDAIGTSDVVVISGAVSRGSRDWIPKALDGIGERVFHGVAQRPGRPMGFWGAEGGCAVFALPGNPVSTLIAVHRYVIPFLHRMQLMPEAKDFHVQLFEDFSYKPKLTCYLPVRMEESGGVKPCPVNNSGDYARLADADGFIQLPAHENCWSSGSAFPYYPWRR